VVLQQAAIAALGEIGAVNAVDSILRFASSEDWLIRQRLAEALGAMPTEKSISALKYLVKDQNSSVAQAAQFSLDRLSS
jgi:HEAT repeat protein